MRIFILTSEFPPSFGGGVSMYVEEISKAYAAAGHQVTVVVRSDDEDSVEQLSDGYRVCRFKHCVSDVYRTLGYWPALSFDYSNQLEKIVKNDKELPDIVEVQDYNGLGYYLFQRRLAGEEFFSKFKIVVHLHTPTFELTRINKGCTSRFPEYWIGEMERMCLAAADGVVTQSNFLANKLQKYCSKKINIIPLPYCVQSGEVGNVSIDTDVLYMGRFEYRKGVLQLLDAFKAIWDSGSQIKLRMIGGDTLFAVKNVYLREEAKSKFKHYIDNGLLEILDTVPPSLLSSIIGSSKVVVVPSLYENYPYTCLLAMSNSRPMLVSSEGGQSEMVGDCQSSGLIFDWSIRNDFSDKLLSLLSKSDSELRDIGENAKNRIVSICDPSNNVFERISVFESILKLGKHTYPIPEYVSRLTNGVPGSFRSNAVDCKKRFLSIIIPYFNLGHHIEETVESALAVQYPLKEIIIVNDGTSDLKSIDALERIKTNFPEIIVVNISNAGLANARNVGVKTAKGEFVTFLDADDLVNPTFYSKAVKVLELNSEVSFVYSWLEYFEGASGVWPTFNTSLPFMACANMLSAFCIVRKADFLEFGVNDMDMEYGMEDYESWLRMVGNGCIGFALPEALVKYRVRSDSMSRQFNRNMQRYLYEKLAEKNSNIYHEYGLDIFKMLVSNGPGYLWNNPTYQLPEVGFAQQDSTAISVMSAPSDVLVKNELVRISQSKVGKRLVEIAFRLGLNKLIK